MRDYWCSATVRSAESEPGTVYVLVSRRVKANDIGQARNCFIRHLREIGLVYAELHIDWDTQGALIASPCDAPATV